MTLPEVRNKLAEGLALIQRCKDTTNQIREVAAILGEANGHKTYNLSGLLVKVKQNQHGGWGLTIKSEVVEL